MAAALVNMGYHVTTPAREEHGMNWATLPASEAIKLKKSFVDAYLEKIRQSDAVLIANFPKQGIDGYVGPNTLMEAAFSYSLGIPVIFLFDPANQACGLECIAVSKGCLHGDVANIADVLGFMM